MSDTTLSVKLQHAFFHKLCTAKRRRWQASSSSSSTPRYLCSASSTELTSCSRLSHDRIKYQFRIPHSALAPTEKFLHKKRKRSNSRCPKHTKQRESRKAHCVAEPKHDVEINALPSEVQVMQEIAALSYYPKIMLDCWRQKRVQCGKQQEVVNRYREELSQCQHNLQVANTLFEIEKARRQELRNRKQQALNTLQTKRHDLEYERDYLKNLGAVLNEFDAKLVAVKQDNLTVNSLQKRSSNVLLLFKKYESKTKSEFNAMRKRVSALGTANAEKLKELNELQQQQLLADCEKTKPPVPKELMSDLEKQLAWCRLKENEINALIAVNSNGSCANIQHQLQIAQQTFQKAYFPADGAYPSLLCYYIATFWRFLSQCSGAVAHALMRLLQLMHIVEPSLTAVAVINESTTINAATE